MRSTSAGILLHRRRSGRLEVLLLHPGGPYWGSKDEGAWTIPKGLCEEGEEPLDTAKREFEEETGTKPPGGEFVPLDPVRQPGGKWVHAFAVRGDFDPGQLASNTFSMEWPPRSGERREFPEADRCAWMPLSVARTKILRGQLPLLDQLSRLEQPSRVARRATRGRPSTN
jgi:predicted NUDIX family NTP pyrophosphohydrolase